MSWSLNIGSVASTAIRVHVTFLLFLVLENRKIRDPSRRYGKRWRPVSMSLLAPR